MSLNIKLSKSAIFCPKKVNFVGDDNKFSIAAARFTSTTLPVRSEAANTCLMIGINAGKNNNCLMHLAPEQQSLQSLRSGLEKCIERLKSKCSKDSDSVRAILIGGKALDQKDAASKGSFDLYNTAANLFDKLGVPFSMICGKYKGVANDNISIVGENGVIWNDSFKDIKLPKIASQDEVAQMLEEKYQIVELSDEVPVSMF